MRLKLINRVLRKFGLVLLPRRVIKDMEREFKDNYRAMKKIPEWDADRKYFNGLADADYKRVLTIKEKYL